MQDRTAILLGYGSLLAGYGFLILTYLVVRRKAQRDSAGRPIVEIQGWKSFSSFLCAGLLLGANSWTITLAYVFANLVPSLDETCRSLITQTECRRAVWNWQLICVAVGVFAVAAFVVIVRETKVEAERTASPPERSYPPMLLACSHCLFVVSWLLCTPLTYPLKVFNLVGRNHWAVVSTVFAFCAITAYISGTAQWIIALVRIFYAWRRRSRNGTLAGA